MNTKTGHESFEEQEVESIFREFWSCIAHLDTTLSTDMTEGELAAVQEDIDALIDLSDRVYCRISEENRSMPDTPFGVEKAIEERAEMTVLCEEDYRETFYRILEVDPEKSVREAWVNTLDELDRKKDELEAKRCSTSVSDWR